MSEIFKKYKKGELDKIASEAVENAISSLKDLQERVGDGDVKREQLEQIIRIGHKDFFESMNAMHEMQTGILMKSMIEDFILNAFGRGLNEFAIRPEDKVLQVIAFSPIETRQEKEGWLYISAIESARPYRKFGMSIDVWLEKEPVEYPSDYFNVSEALKDTPEVISVKEKKAEKKVERHRQAKNTQRISEKGGAQPIPTF